MSRQAQVFGRWSGVAAKPITLVCALFSIILFAPFFATEARAQACCTATGAGEFAVVGRCHNSVLTAQLGYEPTLGTYDSQGRFNAFRGASLQDMLVSVGAGSRFGTERFQVYGSIPLRVQYRQFSGMDGSWGWGVGDGSLGVRWMFLEDMMSGIFAGDRDTYFPFLDGYLNLRIPSGRAPEVANDPVGADVTGRGHWSAVAGLKAVKFVTYKHVVGAYGEVGYSLGRPIERGQRTLDYRPGPEVATGVTYQYIRSVRWSWGAMAGIRFEGTAAEEGETIQGSSKRRLLLGAHFTRSLVFPFWEASISATNDAWGDFGGRNMPFVGPTIAISVQRNFL